MHPSILAALVVVAVVAIVWKLATGGRGDARFVLTVNGRLEKDLFTGITLTGDAREVYRAELREEAWKE